MLYLDGIRFCVGPGKERAVGKAPDGPISILRRSAPDPVLSCVNNMLTAHADSIAPFNKSRRQRKLVERKERLTDAEFRLLQVDLHGCLRRYLPMDDKVEHVLFGSVVLGKSIRFVMQLSQRVRHVVVKYARHELIAEGV